MNPNDCRSRLGELLQAQNELIVRANEYLLVIRKSIAESRLDNLQQSLGNSELGIDRIEELEQKRLRLLAEFGFDKENDSLEKCITWCDSENGQLAELYRQLISNLYELRHSIQVNSLLVNRGQERVRRSIGILTGAGGSGLGKTYGNKGQTINPAGRRDIAVA